MNNKENKYLNEVYPNKGESKKDFIARFMEVTKDEYPDRSQRFAVANSYWDRRNKVNEEEHKMISEFLEELNKIDESVNESVHDNIEEILNSLPYVIYSFKKVNEDSTYRLNTGWVSTTRKADNIYRKIKEALNELFGRENYKLMYVGNEWRDGGKECHPVLDVNIKNIENMNEEKKVNESYEDKKKEAFDRLTSALESIADVHFDLGYGKLNRKEFEEQIVDKNTTIGGYRNIANAHIIDMYKIYSDHFDSLSSKDESLKEEYGPHEGSYILDEIARDVELGNTVGSITYIDENDNEKEVGWTLYLTINGKEIEDLDLSLVTEEYFLEECSYPIKDGFDNYYDVEVTFDKTSGIPEEDLRAMGFSRSDIIKYGQGEDVTTYFTFRIEFDDEDFELDESLNESVSQDIMNIAKSKGYKVHSITNRNTLNYSDGGAG